MGNQTHTQGPWLIQPPEGKGVMHFVWRTNGDEANTGYRRIARDIENPADATLIAAAPDLLAALEAARTEIPFALEGSALTDQIDAAISKARGEL